MKSQLQKIEGLVKLLIANEIAAKRLYTKFEIWFPEFPLWTQLIKEEELHALMLKKLLSKTDFHSLLIDTKYLKEKYIKKSIDEINQIIDSTEIYDLTEALKIAYALESEMLEANYFRVFHSDDKYFKNIFLYLEKDTRKHNQQILTELNKRLK